MRAAPAQAEALLAWLTRVLVGVAVLTFAFTEVNVTLFATSRGVPWPIAILLDPMVGLALAGVLYADARLAAWGLRPPGWSAALRWFTALAATAMNTWTSVWPTGVIGWPRHADPAGIVLHGIPTVMLILLTEAIAAYRRAITPLLGSPTVFPPPAPPTAPAAPGPRADRGQPSAPADPNAPTDHSQVPTDTAPNALGSRQDRTEMPSLSGKRPSGGLRAHSPAAPVPVPRHSSSLDVTDGTPPAGHRAEHTIEPPSTATAVAEGPQTANSGAGNGDDPELVALRQRARQLDADVRAKTGQGASTWRLRTRLHIGLPRAKELYAELNPSTSADSS
ncbi:extensin [Streptomyces sp. NPDC050095]|uniref:extensin n=1 Tax=unclassified Streptomyces TaxID=2593676 RepID=UPI003424F4EB